MPDGIFADSASDLAGRCTVLFLSGRRSSTAPEFLSSRRSSTAPMSHCPNIVMARQITFQFAGRELTDVWRTRSQASIQPDAAFFCYIFHKSKVSADEMYQKLQNLKNDQARVLLCDVVIFLYSIVSYHGTFMSLPAFSHPIVLDLPSPARFLSLSACYFLSQEVDLNDSLLRCLTTGGFLYFNNRLGSK